MELTTPCETIGYFENLVPVLRAFTRTRPVYQKLRAFPDFPIIGWVVEADGKRHGPSMNLAPGFWMQVWYVPKPTRGGRASPSITLKDQKKFQITRFGMRKTAPRIIPSSLSDGHRPGMPSQGREQQAASLQRCV